MLEIESTHFDSRNDRMYPNVGHMESDIFCRSVIFQYQSIRRYNERIWLFVSNEGGYHQLIERFIAFYKLHKIWTGLPFPASHPLASYKIVMFGLGTTQMFAYTRTYIGIYVVREPFCWYMENAEHTTAAKVAFSIDLGTKIICLGKCSVYSIAKIRKSINSEKFILLVL